MYPPTAHKTIMYTPIRKAAVLSHVAINERAEQAQQALATRLDCRDERGDVAPRTIGIAIMAGVAVAVGAIIKKKVTGKANSISLE